MTFLVVTALAYHWRFGRQQETASLLARPSRLARPGTVTLHYAGPQASELELAPSNGCDRRPAYWICHVAESTAFTVTVKSGSTEVARVTAEVAVESPASVR
ncbi:MAG: hypothetical protein JNK87_24185 [Bryobacterales bacterium]|nr:hypothetical protein [Bryobacterales bacterium]